VPEAADDPAASPEERARGKVFAASLGMATLTRAWQLLLKGLGEVKESPRPLAAADMVLVRLAYAADLPAPDDVLRRLGSSGPGTGGAAKSGGSGGSAGGGARAALAVVPPSAARREAPRLEQPRVDATAAREPRPAEPAATPAIRLARFEDVVALCAEKRDIQLKTALERDVHLVRFEEGSIDFSLAPGASPRLAQTLTQKLRDWTGARWMITLSRDPGAPSLRQQAEAREAEKLAGVETDPLVRGVLARFPGAKIVAVRDLAGPAEVAAPLTVRAEPREDVGEDVGFDDTIYTDDDL
jgi:DNA polymerase-3 subunit gamma/tau